jgi:hypothetical protein
MTRIMRTDDAISGKEGMVYITIDGSSLEYAEIIKFDAKVTYKKAKVARVGARMDGSKIIGAEGTGAMTVHYHRPENRKMALDYIRTGKTPIFDAMVVNDDKSSFAGKQTTLVKNIVPDEATIAKLDGESEDTLTEEIPFTYDDFDFLEQFKVINN